MMEDSIVRCSHSDTLRSPSAHPPLTRSPFPIPPWLALAAPGSGYLPMCPPSVPPAPHPPPFCPQMLVCAADFRQKKNSCLEDVFNSVDVMSMFSSVCSEPDLAHPKQKHKGSFLVLHNILLGLFPFFFFKKKNKQKKLVFNLFMDSSVRLTIPL